MGTQVNIASVLEDAIRRLRDGGIEDSALEARILLESALQRSRTWMIAHPDHLVETEGFDVFQALVERRLGREPIAYLTKKREFYGLEFYVDSRVLIPRPETERLVDLAIAAATRRGGKVTVVDVGTGSGAIAVAVSNTLPEATVVAVDPSIEALCVAQMNARRFGTSARVQIVQGDLLSWLGQPVDVIVANLPYIPSERMSQLPTDVREYEPVSALDGGPGGMSLMDELIDQASGVLAAGGELVLECEPEQIVPLTDRARRAFAQPEIESHTDGFGDDRFLRIRRPA